MNSRNGTQLNNAIVVFTREPLPGLTKTRLMSRYTSEQCADLHKCFISDIAETVAKVNADVIVAYTGGEPVFLSTVFRNAKYHEQIEGSLGDRMLDAISYALSLGYKKAILIGTDTPELRTDTLNDSFARLDISDVVIGPAEDGGYYLIGMKSLCGAAFEIEQYGNSTVLDNTIRSIENAGLSVVLTDSYSDIDEPHDVQRYIDRMRIDKCLQNSYTGRYLGANARVSVIIPVFNEEAVIEDMLAQLRIIDGEAEIIIVDGGSTDKTLEHIGNEFTVLHSKKERAAQMNLGAKSANGDILFFLHCDCRLPENAIEDIRHCMTDHYYGCFGVKFESGNFFMWTNRLISNHRAWRRGLPFGDQGIFIDRDLFFEMGMFPEIPVMEDYEFGRRMKRHGYMPGKTEKRIVTSDRRYGKRTIGILKTEFMMWNLRRKYRQGVNTDDISNVYRDIR